MRSALFNKAPGVRHILPIQRIETDANCWVCWLGRTYKRIRNGKGLDFLILIKILVS